MTRVLDAEPHDSGTDVTAPNRADEGYDTVFSYRELARLDEALTMSSRDTGLPFTLYIGDLGPTTRVRAEELHAHGGDPVDSVLLAVSPGPRVIEAVTGSPAARPPARASTRPPGRSRGGGGSSGCSPAPRPPAGCPTAPARWRCCR